nr:sulfite exporter TauE/SafE family protein [uncultured Carboxylicivirga sp.]
MYFYLMDISALNILLLILAGLFAGFINTLAGSGSLITLPMLMFLGLSPHQANATNRIAIFIQNIVAVRNFRKQKTLDYRSNIYLIIPALFGSVAGALVSINISEQALNYFIGILLFVMFFVILLKPDKWIKEQAGHIEGKPTYWQLIIFFFIGFYGGFIQAGVGLFLLAGLVLGVGYNLIQANAVKVLIVLCYTAIALVFFIWAGQINYLYGFILAAGNASGAFIASKYAKQIGVKPIRYILLGAVMLAAMKVLGIFDLLF